MFFAPIKDFKAAMDRNNLGDLNPTPWAFMLGNCFGFVIYSVLLQNLWIYFANVFALILSVYFNLGAIKLKYQGHHSREMRKSLVSFLQEEEKSKRLSLYVQSGSSEIEENQPSDDKNRTTTTMDWATIVWNVTSQNTPAPAAHENLVLMLVVVWILIASVVGFADDLSSDTKQFIVGLSVNFNLIFFYGAPLSTIFKILKERHTASIHIPLMFTSALNGCFWTAYGIAVKDYWIYVPNGIGAILGGVQIILCVIFPRARNKRDDKNEESDESTTDDAGREKAKSRRVDFAGEIHEKGETTSEWSKNGHKYYGHHKKDKQTK